MGKTTEIHFDANGAVVPARRGRGRPRKDTVNPLNPPTIPNATLLDPQERKALAQLRKIERMEERIRAKYANVPEPVVPTLDPPRTYTRRMDLASRRYKRAEEVRQAAQDARALLLATAFGATAPGASGATDGNPPGKPLADAPASPPHDYDRLVDRYIQRLYGVDHQRPKNFPIFSLELASILHKGITQTVELLVLSLLEHTKMPATPEELIDIIGKPVDTRRALITLQERSYIEADAKDGNRRYTITKRGHNLISRLLTAVTSHQNQNAP